MKVSIIIPTYNQAKYLSETLDSVLLQIYQNWECIIINDGSTDDTEKILKKYSNLDTRFKYFFQKNSGPSGARNLGISKSSGDFILPLDSDDLISKDYLSEAIEVFKQNPKVKLVYCQAKLFGEKIGLWNLPEYSYEKILFENMIFCTAMFRKSDFNLTNGYNVNMKDGYEDWDFWLSFLKKNDLVYRIPKVLFHYRIRNDSRNNFVKRNKKIIKRIKKEIFLNHKNLYKDKKFLVILKKCDLYKAFLVILFKLKSILWKSV